MRKAIIGVALVERSWASPRPFAGEGVHDATSPGGSVQPGTANAHEHVPATTRSGKTTPGHAAIPGTPT